MSAIVSLSRVAALLIGVAMLLAVGCSDGTAVKCAAGTRLDGDKCVLLETALNCGPGTSADGGVCVADPVDTVGDTGGAGDATADTTDAGPDTADADTDAAGSGDADVTGDADAAPVCVPDCAGRSCGGDGCGGSCGSCTDEATPICNTALGVCVATCVPDCEGKNCGDDGCGGTCGSCAAGQGCIAAGRCVPDAWTCEPLYYAAGDACDCGCGAPDLDCKDPSAFVAGCASLQVCSEAGTCVSAVPAGWTCAPTSYGALDGCDCGCGVVDPDCKVAGQPVLGCGVGGSCNADGTCKACAPSCTDKMCGDDGCGGSCGSCTTGSKTACSGGQCVDPCSPKPLACTTAVCGSDGCGGTCGSCASYETCENGACNALPLPEAATSCVAKCGTVATSGCSCADTCKDNGNCCADYAQICSCKPNCTGKTCGDDGCGGSCGTCDASAPYCSAAGTCTSTCAKQCDGKSCGDDGCGGTCGTCGAGSTCAWSNQCVPNDWFCAVAYYQDGTACDCGCGAPDPDCVDAKALTFGCPSKADACGTDGICKVSFCAANSACSGGWCKGAYAAGGGVYKGVCAAANGSAKGPGEPCKSDGECSTELCLNDKCRLLCQSDAACPGEQQCLALPVQQGASSAILGYAGVCVQVAGSGAPCASQKSCTTAGEVCTALLDPKTFGPAYRCTPGTQGGGKSCGAGVCPTGQICAPGAAGATCGMACPGGDADCPSGQVCGKAALHNHGTSDEKDDPMVAVCVPK
ncbi:MAG: hypothetical protein H6747_08255 [Deltaproteobacteria bacterium]|nr:hypothetical protein [Deltaproteobacteria bacterium]